MEFFNRQKPRIETKLKSFLESKTQDYKKVNGWGKDVCGRLLDFTTNGKMLRGGLSILTHDLFSGKKPEEALKAAVVMELYQSAFLIHDDIMDRDTTRRGKTSFFYQYKEKGDSLGFNDPYHFGESLGICAGDVAFFMGFEMLSQLDLAHDIHSRVMNFCANEISYVGLAQMQDIYFGYLKDSPEPDEILNLYLYKTGRYTFSLPMMLGAMIAGKDGKELKLLEKLGEKLGLIFQIKDDELGLFGDEGEIGKPVGSDLKENKKSLYHYYLFQKIKEEERKKFRNIFGSSQISLKEIDIIREKVEEMGIREEVQEKLKAIAGEVGLLIDDLTTFPVESEPLKVIKDLLRFSLERKK